ncbi:MAG TPA: hypothetical protein DCP28_35970, partial [Cytophagales bacterium]|nr:hypothetical protein [Cytophagales bacterium]
MDHSKRLFSWLYGSAKKPNLMGVILGIGSLLFAWGCQTKGENPASDARVALPTPVNTVRGFSLEKTTFQEELYSNGKIVSVSAVALHTQQAGTLARLSMANGQRVRKGDTLAWLNNPAIIEQYHQAEAAYNLSLLDFEDILLSRGYALKDTAETPADVVEMAQLRSNYNTSLSQYRLAQQQRNQLWIVAPISGTLGDVKAVAEESQPAGTQL